MLPIHNTHTHMYYKTKSMVSQNVYQIQAISTLSVIVAKLFELHTAIEFIISSSNNIKRNNTWRNDNQYFIVFVIRISVTLIMLSGRIR